MWKKQTSLLVGLACAALAGLPSRAVAQADANPGMPFYGYGSIVADPAYPVVNETTHVVVTVGNTGPDDATGVQVKLSFNDWGVTFMGWQQIDTVKTIARIPSGGFATAEFDHVFVSRTHTCLEALIVGADDNTNLNDDRGQINLEVISAGETFSYGVPIANNGDVALNLLVLGHERGGADGGQPVKIEDLHLAPGEMAVVPVFIDLRELEPGDVVEYLVDAVDLARPLDPHGHEHVLLRVVKATALDSKTAVADEMAELAATLPRGAAANQFKAALKHLDRALDPRLWVDENRVGRAGGAAVFANEGFFDLKAKQVLPLLPYDAKVAVEGALLILMDCDRILAQTAIFDAGVPAEAQALFDQAEVLRLQGDGGAILLYKQAWLVATR